MGSELNIYLGISWCDIVIVYISHGECPSLLGHQSINTRVLDAGLITIQNFAYTLLIACID